MSAIKKVKEVIPEETNNDSKSDNENEDAHTHVMNSMQFHMEEENYL